MLPPELSEQIYGIINNLPLETKLEKGLFIREERFLSPVVLAYVQQYPSLTQGLDLTEYDSLYDEYGPEEGIFVKRVSTIYENGDLLLLIEGERYMKKDVYSRNKPRFQVHGSDEVRRVGNFVFVPFSTDILLEEHEEDEDWGDEPEEMEE
ncbi:MAG: hypothetical protein ACYCQJ_15165 [Nitrososphaerales archaeon]